MDKRWIRGGGIITALFLTAGVILAGCNSQEEGIPVIPPVATGIPVVVQKAKEGTLPNEQTFMGSIAAVDTGEIYSKASGILTKLYVKKGEKVKQGQVIAELDSSKQRLDVKDAQARLSGAVARLEQANASQSVTATPSARELAEQSLQLAKENVERIKRLVEAGALPQAQLKAAEDDWIQAQNSFRTSTISDVKDEAGVAVSSSDVEAAKVSLEKAKRGLEDTVITAFKDGTISELHATVGDVVSTQTAVAQVVSLEQVKVTIQVPETERFLFAQGAQVQVSIPVAGKRVEGHVSYLGLTAFQDTRLYPIEITIENPAHYFLPGMRADVNIVHTQEHKGILLPQEAIVDEDGTSYVFLVKGDVVYKQDIEVVAKDEKFVLVDRGVADGELVVVSGQEKLRNQSRVTIEKTLGKGE